MERGKTDIDVCIGQLSAPKKFRFCFDVSKMFVAANDSTFATSTVVYPQFRRKNLVDSDLVARKRCMDELCYLVEDRIVSVISHAKQTAE